MRQRQRWATALLIAGALTTPALVTGCMHHHDYDRDEYAQRQYVWTEAEVPYYNQWENDTRREHRDWNQRSAEEQRQYWDWRRQHGSDQEHRDHDRDRGGPNNTH